MEMERWLEEAMVITNKSLRLMPSSVFKEHQEWRRGKGISVETVAKVCNQLGFTKVDEAQLLRFKEVIPSLATLSQDQIGAYKENNQATVQAAQFLVNYFIGVAKEIPVTIDFRTLDERSDKDVRKVLRALVQDASSPTQQKQKEANSGNSDSSAS